MDKSLKTVLVTGGAGYVGSVLIKKLLSQNFNIKIIDSLVYGSDGISDHLGNNSLELINTDIRKIQDISDIFHNVDCVIHLAAVVGEPLCKKIPLAAKQIKEYATKNHWESLRKYRRKVSALLLCSTFLFSVIMFVFAIPIANLVGANPFYIKLNSFFILPMAFFVFNYQSLRGLKKITEFSLSLSQGNLRTTSTYS